MTDPKYDLKQLRETCDRILREARATPGVEGAINWGDLHCVAALRVEDDEGRIHYRVEIEESSPDAGDLQRFVAEQLKEAGFPFVGVCTEW